ncbi:unnamed protein product [Staurois parvus]|uniref:Uncharacterized protein n=1 Tax=Staurois parvus TaxID=386267 RepID=A0ABN9D1P4_9NEOB|nr:unnamed protein product [Staurois parvus]
MMSEEPINLPACLCRVGGNPCELQAGIVMVGIQTSDPNAAGQKALPSKTL